jgi:hypothetical protein
VYENYKNSSLEKHLALNALAYNGEYLPANSFVSLVDCGPPFTEGENRDRTIKSVVCNDWLRVRIEENRVSANFQVNPLCVPFILRRYPQLLHYFAIHADGFCYRYVGGKDFFTLSADSLTLPGYSDLNAKLQEIHSRVGVSSCFTFLPVDSYRTAAAHGGFPEDAEYVQRFIESHFLPLGRPHTRNFAHDWSYHFSALLFPEILENLRLTIIEVLRGTDWRVEAREYEWNYYGHSLDESGEIQGQKKKELQTYSAYIYRQIAIAIDVVTAKIVKLLVRIDGDGFFMCTEDEAAMINSFRLPVSRNSLHKVLWMEVYNGDFFPEFSDEDATLLSPLGEYFTLQIEQLSHYL